jgi:hypothetical protein
MRLLLSEVYEVDHSDWYERCNQESNAQRYVLDMKTVAAVIYLFDVSGRPFALAQKLHFALFQVPNEAHDE